MSLKVADSCGQELHPVTKLRNTSIAWMAEQPSDAFTRMAVINAQDAVWRAFLRCAANRTSPFLLCEDRLVASVGKSVLSDASVLAVILNTAFRVPLRLKAFCQKAILSAPHRHAVSASWVAPVFPGVISIELFGFPAATAGDAYLPLAFNYFVGKYPFALLISDALAVFSAVLGVIHVSMILQKHDNSAGTTQNIHWEAEY